MVDINDFEKQTECLYKEERYSVRDNGAVMRHQKEGQRLRKLDNKWTFGIPNEKTGYMEFAGQRVHRIVAYAFLGKPELEDLIVDHIDTNRRNNRPENLRWLTRLENVLKNPITKARIENICGSVEAFLANPSLLNGHEHHDPNFSWMRAVTKEEAKVTYDRLIKWAENPIKTQGNGIGEWIFEQDKSNQSHHERNTNPYRFETVSNNIEIPQEIEQEYKPIETKSLTPNAIQLNWKNPAKFPCCPQIITSTPLKDYMQNLSKGKVFSENHWGKSKILDFKMTNPETIWVMCDVSIGWKSHALTKITFVNNLFVHENMGVYDIGDEPEEIFASIK